MLKYFRKLWHQSRRVLSLLHCHWHCVYVYLCIAAPWGCFENSLWIVWNWYHSAFPAKWGGGWEGGMRRKCTKGEYKWWWRGWWSTIWQIWYPVNHQIRLQIHNREWTGSSTMCATWSNQLLLHRLCFRSRGSFMLDCRRNNGTCKWNHDDNLIQFDNFLLKLILYAATRASRVNNRKNTAEEKVEKKDIVTKVIAGFLTVFSWKNILSKGFLELVKD